jgi:predicted RNA methylase
MNCQFHNHFAQRPEPITHEMSVMCMNRNTDISTAVEELIAGSNILIEDFYDTGMKLLFALRKHLQKELESEQFSDQRIFRNTYYQLSQRIFLEIRNNKLSVRKAPSIGWLRHLYPDIADFSLTFSQVQGLNSSWQWYKKGVFIPLLNRKIHPFYNTYFPTRYEHLELFAQWIKNYKGKKSSAYDIGTGSGILSYKLLDEGFEKVYATDNNINALISVKNETSDQSQDSLELSYGDLFADFNYKSELILFNPPWVAAPDKDLSGLDTAIYYTENLFSRFFEQALERLNDEGKIILLFSNFVQITNQLESHPIHDELKNQNMLKVDFIEKKNVKPASANTRRNKSLRLDEKVELWQLSKQ